MIRSLKIKRNGIIMHYHPYIPRQLSDRLLKLFHNFACLVITGSRQVGKSTLLEHLFPKVRSIEFDPVQDIQNARKEPELFLDNNPPPLILDEIQYAPDLNIQKGLVICPIDTSFFFLKWMLLYPGISLRPLHLSCTSCR